MKIYAVIISAFLFATNMKGQSCNAKPVPFYEGFQSVTANSQWPPCWLGASMGTLFTFTSPSGSFAGCTASSDNFFHSPEFILNAGYTYSASMLFSQSIEGQLWNRVALHIMKTSTQDLGIVASGTNFTTTDTIVGGTFSVANTGTYHLGVEMLKASGWPPPMTLGFFDDLRIDCANNMTVQSSPALICAGETVVLSGSGATSFTFQNSFGGSQDNPYYDNPLADETYTVLGHIYGNCVDTRVIAYKVDECLGLKEHKLMVNVYPNPFNDHVTLQTERGTGVVTIFDSVGNRVHSRIITSVSTDIGLRDLKPGIYVLRFVDGADQLVKKLICK